MTPGPARACLAGHGISPRKPGRACPGCRRDAVVAQVAAADRSLAGEQVAAAVDAVAGHGAALRSLAAALAEGRVREVLAGGAPPVAGRLVTELISRGRWPKSWRAPARRARLHVPAGQRCPLFSPSRRSVPLRERLPRLRTAGLSNKAS